MFIFLRMTMQFLSMTKQRKINRTKYRKHCSANNIHEYFYIQGEIYRSSRFTIENPELNTKKRNPYFIHHITTTIFIEKFCFQISIALSIYFIASSLLLSTLIQRSSLNNQYIYYQACDQMLILVLRLYIMLLRKYLQIMDQRDERAVLLARKKEIKEIDQNSRKYFIGDESVTSSIVPFSYYYILRRRIYYNK